MLVKVENAISPLTCLREARSIATAPPSDQPPAMIRVWVDFQGRDDIVVDGIGRSLASFLGGATAAHAVADVVRDNHVQAQPAKSVD